MDKELIASAYVAAAALLGKDASMTELNRKAAEVLSAMKAAVEDPSKMGPSVEGSFSAKLMGVKLHEKSQRLVLTLGETNTKYRNEDIFTGERLPEGTEQIRSPRMDTPEGEVFRSKVKELSAGESVRVTRGHETNKKTGQKYKIALNIEAE